MIEKDRDRVRLASPKDSNHQFEAVLSFQDPLYLALRSSGAGECFVGFDSEGEALRPCGMTFKEDERKLLINEFLKKSRT